MQADNERLKQQEEAMKRKAAQVRSRNYKIALLPSLTPLRLRRPTAS